MNDPRVGAWVQAWNRLDAVNKASQKHGYDDPAVATYRESLLYEAEILAELAKAPDRVAFAVGEYLAEAEQREADQNERIREILKGV